VGKRRQRPPGIDQRLLRCRRPNPPEESASISGDLRQRRVDRSGVGGSGVAGAGVDSGGM